jgi:hypothetical protein
LQGVEAGCDALRLSASELPGQDSNLDKENQNTKTRFKNGLESAGVSAGCCLCLST